MILRLALAAAFFIGWTMAADADAVRLGSERLGNIFAPGETVAVSVISDQPSVDWSLTDMWGHVVAKSALPIVEGHGVVTPPPVGLGWFRLDVQAGSASTATNLAIVPQPRPGTASPRFGVMTHFAQGWPTDIVPLIARAGLGQVRDELYWQTVETSPGQYSLSPRDHEYLEALGANHLKLLLELDFGNPLYDGGMTPYSDEGVRAFAEYGRAMVSQLGERLSGVEIWNEYNGSFCKGPCLRDRPGTYAKLLKATAAAVRHAAPGLPIAGGASVLLPVPWFRALFEQDAFADVDALAIHPYRAPEGLEQPLGDLRALVAQQKFGRDKQIWATEFGSSKAGPDAHPEAARYLVRDAAIMLSEGVSRVSWYLMRDYANFQTSGLLTAPDNPLGRYVPWPAYVAYANLIRELGGAEAWGREPTDPRTRLYRFGAGAGEVRIGWAPDGASNLDIETTNPLVIVDLMGNERRVSPANGVIGVELGRDPVFIKGHATAVHEQGRAPLLTDSARDFPAASGGGWSYLAYLCPEGADANACLADYDPQHAEPLVFAEDRWAGAWRSPRYHFLAVSAENAHPSAFGSRQVWAVRRWVSPEGGHFVISGDAARLSPRGDGARLIILRDGKPIWQSGLGGTSPASAAFHIETDAKPGTTFDFAITPGPGTDITDDATDFHAVVSRGSA